MRLIEGRHDKGASVRCADSSFKWNPAVATAAVGARSGEPVRSSSGGVGEQRLHAALRKPATAASGSRGDRRIGITDGRDAGSLSRRNRALLSRPPGLRPQRLYSVGSVELFPPVHRCWMPDLNLATLDDRRCRRGLRVGICNRRTEQTEQNTRQNGQPESPGAPCGQNDPLHLVRDQMVSTNFPDGAWRTPRHP